MAAQLAIPNAAAGPQGKAEERDDELLLLLLLISLADVALAERLWDSLVPPAWRGLLGAVAIPDVRRYVGTLPPIWFDVRTQRYGLGSRGFITVASMFDVLNRFRDAAAQQQATAVAQVYAGTTDIGTWQRSTEQALKLIAVATVAAAVGGASRLTPERLTATSDALRFHAERLARFAAQIEAGEVVAEAAERRAALYPESVVTSLYDDARRTSAIAAGFTEERNILDGDADHCRRTESMPPGAPDCPSLTDLGWVSIGQMPPPGARLCKWNCRCHFEFRRDESQSN